MEDKNNFSLRTKSNNYHVSNKMNITNEENLLRMIFNKAQLQPIQHYEIIRHINVRKLPTKFMTISEN